MHDEIDNKKQRLTIFDMPQLFDYYYNGGSSPDSFDFDEIAMLYYFVSSYVMMYSKPYYFYKNVLVSEYSQKVFWEYHYDYINTFEQDIEDGKVPASYANCNSLSCADDYTEQTDVKPDVWNDNLGMAARQWMHDYY